MRVKKNYFYGFIVLLILAAAALAYYSPLLKPKIIEIPRDNDDKIEWHVDTEGRIAYQSERGNVKFNRQDYEKNESLLVSKIIYQSRDKNIYGLLVMPTSADELLPGIILLPGAGVSKESELELARKIALLNAVVLVIDQRGTGETDGIFPSLDEDYVAFKNEIEPVQHLMVYDALRAYDLLYRSPFVDSNRILIAGESLGGRIAVIAAAIDKNINGVLVISSSGFDFKGGGDINRDTFLRSIDSDHYIGLISPRKLVMIHSTNDNIIPLASANNTFSKAKEPKQFIVINNSECRHGYCDSMWPSLAEALDYLVEINSMTIAAVPDK
jgi:uncharacterized protein